jgi:hypothetical protein
MAHGCSLVRRETAASPEAVVASPSTHRGALFRDSASRAGIRFRLGHGGKSPLNILETIGAGCALLDADGDGRQDLLFLGQTGTASAGRSALYRNRGDGTFEDVTTGSGLEAPGFWTGCATGDWNNDGGIDLFIAGNGQSRLLRNAGNGRFQDESAARGVRVPGWASSAQFADVDADGWLDLYVARYVRFGATDPRLCQVGIAPGTGEPVQGACGPEVYDPEVGLFFHNDQGRFREATREFGFADAHGRGLGVAFADANADGRPDLYVANDRMPGDLFHNTGSRTTKNQQPRTSFFANIGVASGTAYGGSGNIQGGMGVDWGDVDADGLPDLFVATFYREPKSLYSNLGQLLFEEAGATAGLGQSALDLVGFGAKFLDVENDGWLDLLFVSGHVVETAERVDRRATYRQPGILFRHQGRSTGSPSAATPRGVAVGLFREATADAGPDLARPIVGRGLATGDWNDDGRVDVLVSDLEGAPLLLENTGAGGSGHWIGLEVLTRHGGPALGAKVRLRAGSRHQVREVSTGGSYLSAHDPRVVIGLGAASTIDEILITWPSGARQLVRTPAVDRYLQVREPGK